MNVDYSVILKCYQCDAPILMSAAREATLRRTHETFYCASGHGQVFRGESDEQKTIRSLKREIEWGARRLRELGEEAALFKCLHPRCRFRNKTRAIVLEHMRHCDRAKKPRLLAANAGPDALNSKVH